MYNEILKTAIKPKDLSLEAIFHKFTTCQLLFILTAIN